MAWKNIHPHLKVLKVNLIYVHSQTACLPGQVSKYWYILWHSSGAESRIHYVLITYSQRSVNVLTWPNVNQKEMSKRHNAPTWVTLRNIHNLYLTFQGQTVRFWCGHTQWKDGLFLIGVSIWATSSVCVSLPYPSLCVSCMEMLLGRSWFLSGCWLSLWHSWTLPLSLSPWRWW